MTKIKIMKCVYIYQIDFSFMKIPSVWKGYEEYAQILLVGVKKGTVFLERSEVEVRGL